MNSTDSNRVISGNTQFYSSRT